MGSWDTLLQPLAARCADVMLQEKCFLVEAVARPLRLLPEELDRCPLILCSSRTHVATCPESQVSCTEIAAVAEGLERQDIPSLLLARLRPRHRSPREYHSDPTSPHQWLEGREGPPRTSRRPPRYPSLLCSSTVAYSFLPQIRPHSPCQHPAWSFAEEGEYH